MGNCFAVQPEEPEIVVAEPAITGGGGEVDVEAARESATSAADPSVAVDEQNGIDTVTAAAAAVAAPAAVSMVTAGEATAQTRGWAWNDNVDYHHTSGCERMCKSIMCAICVAPIVLLLSGGFAGWNERRAVCDMRAIAEGKEVVVPTGCQAATEGDGELVMFSCDLRRDGLPVLSASGDFSSYLTFEGTGLRTEAEILQCVEHKHTETRQDSFGGGTTDVTVYTYEKEWRTHHVDSSHFRGVHSQSYQWNCGGPNPSWPWGAPRSSVQYADRAVIGPYTVPKRSFLDSIPLDDPLMASSAPAGWEAYGFEYVLPSWKANGLGDVRVRFYGNNWARTRVTVLGLNVGGMISRWTASDSWLCSGFQLAQLRMGTHARDTLFTSMEAEAHMLTWAFRLVALVVIWIAFCSLFGPLRVAADCVPLAGPFLGRAVSCIVPIVTCPLAFACFCGIAGVVWVAMRPTLGFGMLALCAICFCGALIVKVYAKVENGKRVVSSADAQPPLEIEPDAQMPESDTRTES